MSSEKIQGLGGILGLDYGHGCCICSEKRVGKGLEAADDEGIGGFEELGEFGFT